MVLSALVALTLFSGGFLERSPGSSCIRGGWQLWEDSFSMPLMLAPGTPTVRSWDLPASPYSRFPQELA